MATRLKQTDRLFSFDSPLGPDKLLVRSLRGTEGISQLFQFHLELASTDFNIDYDQMLGKNVTVGIRQADDRTFRYINGHVSKFRQVPGPGRLALYEAEVVPWLWFLTLTQDCLIYQEKKIPDVIKETFRKYGFQDFEDKLTANYETWVYCCQYRESAFQFVTRLMEVEGIFYFFRHQQGKHTLVMADSKSAHTSCPFQSRFRFEQVPGGGLQRKEDTVFAWRPERKVRSGKYTHKEFNFEFPWQELKSERDTKKPALSRQKYEIYDYPGDYEYQGEGENWVRLRLEEQEVDHDVMEGSGNCRALVPGYRFELAEHLRGDQNGSYVLTQVTHQGHEGTMLTGADAGEATYQSTFTCIPASVEYRPQRKTEKPLMLGSQTATVVGPKGEEIYTDKYGRVKVQFHWDRVGKKDEKSSCWMRVMQHWTGNTWGQIWIPRIGQEVVVDFLEGDPDRPIITGCVYNAENMPPYKLTDYQTRSGVKTRSTKGGKEQNYNELRFDDQKDKELILIHAERDMDISVEKDLCELVEADRHIKVKGEQRETIEGNMSHQVGSSRREKVGQDYLLEAGGVIHLKASEIILDAQQVTYLASGSHIDISQKGVVIEGPMVWVNCGMGRPGGAREAKPEDPKKGIYEKENQAAAPAQPAGQQAAQPAGQQQSQQAGGQSGQSPTRSAAAREESPQFLPSSQEREGAGQRPGRPAQAGATGGQEAADQAEPAQDLAQQQKQGVDQLKAGGSSGITKDFGKPEFLDDRPAPSTPGAGLKEGGTSGITKDFGKVQAVPAQTTPGEALQAEPMTMGEAIQFKPGGSESPTVAHEAAHVVQQRKGTTPSKSEPPAAPPEPDKE